MGSAASPRPALMRRAWVAGLCLLFAAAGGSAQAQAGRLEYAVKATFLYKLAAFVEWPSSAFDDPAGPLKLCVVGTNPFGGQLEQVTAGQKIGNRSVQIRRFDAYDRSSGCHVVYVATADAGAVSRILAATRGRPVLTVTDSSFEDSSRGIIHFVLRDNRVRFEVDPEAAARNGVTLSSKLTSLAAPGRTRTYGP